MLKYMISSLLFSYLGIPEIAACHSFEATFNSLAITPPKIKTLVNH